MPRVAAPPAPSSATVNGADFNGEIALAVERLRLRLGAIIDSVCGGSPRAQDVTDRFGVHRKLGWQIWNVVYSDDPMAAVRFLPNARGIEVWRAAAARRGVPRDLLERLGEAVAQFDRTVRTHAQDREMLEMLVEAQGARPDEAADVRWRKQAFTGNSFIWGVRAKRLLATVILHPSATAGHFDMVRLQGLVELVRTRANVRWPFAQSITMTEDGTVRAPTRVPLDDSPVVRERGGVPLLEAFCSAPLPPVQRRVGENGMIEDELLPGPVGQSGASTVVTGELLRAVAPVRPTTAGEVALFGTGVRTPGELLVSDHVVHRDLWPGAPRELCVFGELISPTSQDERDRVPVPERLQHLGRGMERIRTADIPRYAELLELAFARTSWRPDEFDVYRVRMRYPPIPVSVMVRHPM